MGLGLPLLIVLPVALAAIILAVRFSLDPLRRFRARLEARGARDLSEVPASDLPTEIGPLAATLNGLLARLREAFEAERSFAANAAHELRTPLAGAIAQAQRLQVGNARAGHRSACRRDRGDAQAADAAFRTPHAARAGRRRAAAAGPERGSEGGRARRGGRYRARGHAGPHRADASRDARSCRTSIPTPSGSCAGTSWRTLSVTERRMRRSR